MNDNMHLLVERLGHDIKLTSANTNECCKKNVKQLHYSVCFTKNSEILMLPSSFCRQFRTPRRACTSPCQDCRRAFARHEGQDFRGFAWSQNEGQKTWETWRLEEHTLLGTNILCLVLEWFKPPFSQIILRVKIKCCCEHHLKVSSEFCSRVLSVLQIEGEEKT